MVLRDIASSGTRMEPSQPTARKKLNQIKASYAYRGVSAPSISEAKTTPRRTRNHSRGRENGIPLIYNSLRLLSSNTDFCVVSYKSIIIFKNSCLVFYKLFKTVPE